MKSKEDSGKLTIFERIRKMNGLEWLLVTTALLEFNPIFQAIKGIRSGSVQDVSLLTFISIFVIGGLWLIYGIRIKSIPLIAGNSIKLFSSAVVLLVVWYFS